MQATVFSRIFFSSPVLRTHFVLVGGDEEVDSVGAESVIFLSTEYWSATPRATARHSSK
jgi:hypothetical protein